MANIDLTKYGITGTREIVYNPSYELLFEEETEAGLTGFEVGKLTELDTISVMTGEFTGRSPKDKYIVVGALNGDDTHATFAGQMSGAVVNFNAFISLLNRHHIVSVTLLCILFVTFFFLSYLALSRKHLQDLLEGWTTTTKNKWQHRGLKALKMLSSWVGLSLFLTLLCIITYLLLGEAYDIFITSTLFYLLQKAVVLYDRIRGRKKEIQIHDNNKMSK